MKAEIKIELDNAAFQDTLAGSEVARILRDLADRIQGAAFIDPFDRFCSLRDVNGNRVGRFQVSETRGL